MHRHTLVGVLLGAAAALAVPAQAKQGRPRSVGRSRSVGAADRGLHQPTLLKTRPDQTDNVKDLKVAWTFSTGVLRGHEGSPLVIGDVMYVHTPVPNIVFALDLDDEGKISGSTSPSRIPSVIPIMCCDTVNRGVPTRTARSSSTRPTRRWSRSTPRPARRVWKVVNGDPKKGETGTSAPFCREGQGDRWHLRRRVRRAGTRHRLQHQERQARLARLLGRPRRRDVVRSRKDVSLGKPVGKDSSLKTWNGDQWKIGGGTAWGWYSYDPALNLFYYGTANPSTWNPAQRAGRTASRSTRNGRCRSSRVTPIRAWRLGLPDDAVRRVGLRRRQRDDPCRHGG